MKDRVRLDHKSMDHVGAALYDIGGIELTKAKTHRQKRDDRQMHEQRIERCARAPRRLSGPASHN